MGMILRYVWCKFVWLMVLCAAEESDREMHVMNLRRLQKDKKKRRCFGTLISAFHLGEMLWHIDAGISSWREMQQYMMVLGVCMCVHKCVCKLLIAR